MGEGTKVGTGYIDIHGDFDPIRRELATLKTTWASDTRGLGASFQRAIAPSLASVSKHLRSTGGDVGVLGDQFKGLDGAASTARRAVDQVTTSTTRASNEFASLRSQVEQSRRTTRSFVDDLDALNGGGAADSIKKVSSQVRTLADDLDSAYTDRFARGLDGVKRSAEQSIKSVSATSNVTRSLADDLDEAYSSTTRTTSRVDGFRASVTRAGAGLRGFSSDTRRMIGENDFLGRSFMGVGSRTTVVNQRFQLLRNLIGVMKWPAIITGAGLAAQALSALGAAAVAVSAAVGPAVGVLGALPGALAAAAQGFGVFKLATLGIGDALREQLRSQAAVDTSAIRGADTQRSAARAIAAAQEAVRSARLGVEDATRRVSDAERSYADSLGGLVDAETQVAAAHQGARAAQLALTAAREAARKAINDSRTALTDAALAEEGATFALKDARRALADLSAAPSARALADAHESITDAMRAERNAALALRDAHEGVDDALRGEVRATLALADARDRLNALLAGPDALDVADADDAVADAMRDEERAALGLLDAQRDLARVLADPRASAEDIAKARLALADAENAVGDAARATTRARERLAELESPPSERELAKARLDVSDAEDAVADASDATAKARYGVEDAENAVGDAKRATADAQLKLKELETPASSYELAKARYAVRVAEDGLADARRAHLGAERELLDLEARGIAGSQEVADARRGIADADLAVIDAENGVRDAMRAAGDAARGVTDAERDLAEARRQVRLATQGVRDAQLDATTAMDKGAVAATNLNERFDELPPAAQAFVRTLLQLKPRFDELRNVAAAGFFPGARTGLLAAVKNFGAVRSVVDETARVLGFLTASAGQLVGSPAWGRDIETVGGRNATVIRRVGIAALRVADATRHLVVAAGPLLDWLSRIAGGWARQLDAAARTGRETGRLARFFESTRSVLERLGSITGNVATGFWNIGRAARPLGDDILAALDRASDGWARWTGSVRGQRDLARYFADAKPAIFETGRLVRDIVSAFFRLGKQEGVARLLAQVRTELLPALERTLAVLTKTFAPAIVGAITNVVKLFAQMAGAGGSLSSMVKLIGAFAGGLAWVLESVPGARQLAVAFVSVAGALKAVKVVAAISGITGLGRSAMAAGRAFRLLAAGTAASTVATQTSVGATIAAKVAMVASAAASKAWAGAQWLLNAALTANPIGAVVVGIAALAAGLVIAYTKVGWFRDAVDGAFSWIKDNWPLLLGILTGPIGVAVALIAENFGDLRAKLDGIWTAIKGAASTAWQRVKELVTNPVEAGRERIQAIIGGLRDWLAGRWADVKTAAGDAWQRVKELIGNPIAAARDRVQLIVAGFRDWLGERWTDIKAAADAAWQRVKDLIGNPISAAFERVRELVRSAREWLSEAWGNIKDGAEAAWGRIKELIGNPIAAAVERIKELIGHGGRDPSGLVGWLLGAWETIKDGVGAFATGVKDKIVGVFEGAVRLVAKFINKIISAINMIPGVEIRTIDIDKLATGGKMSSAGVDHYATGGEVRRGTLIDKPMIMMGEEAPRHPEYVIPTNPAYRDRARMLLANAAQAIGFRLGGVLTQGTIAGLAAAQGAPDPALASAVAMAESGGNTQAVNYNTNGTVDRGLFQINSIHPYPASQLFDGIGNTRAAKGVSNNWSTWQPWVAYNSGAYRRFLGQGLDDLGSARGGGIGGALGELMSKGFRWITDRFPNPADILPDWLQETGKWVIGRATSWVKGQVGDLILGGNGGMAAAPPIARLSSMINFANRLDALSIPYGAAGHAGWPINTAGEDCSSTVSKVVHAGGYLSEVLDTTRMATGAGLAGGPGRWVTLHNRALAGNAGHVILEFPNDRWFGTSGSNPGGGPGWFPNPGASYVASMPQKLHPVGLAEGGTIQAPFVGSYLTGGIVPQDGLAYVHEGEEIVPRDEESMVDKIADALRELELTAKIGDERIDEKVRLEVRRAGRDDSMGYRAGASA